MRAPCFTSSRIAGRSLRNAAAHRQWLGSQPRPSRNSASARFSPRAIAYHSGVAFQVPSRKASPSRSRPFAIRTSAVFTLSRCLPLAGLAPQQTGSQLPPRSSPTESSSGLSSSAARTSAQRDDFTRSSSAVFDAIPLLLAEERPGHEAVDHPAHRQRERAQAVGLPERESEAVREQERKEEGQA